MTKKEATDQWSLDGIPKVGPVYREKLIAAGVGDFYAMIVQGPIEVAEITGMDKDDAAEAVNFCRQHLVGSGKLAKEFQSAADMYQDRLRIEKLKTGCDNLDKMLGGGFESQAITELYGEFGSGKTQICFRMCVNAQLPKEYGGLGGSVLYIDTENTFRPERVNTIAHNVKLPTELDPDKFLENITVARAFNSSHQMFIIDAITDMIRDQEVENRGKMPIKLVIMDSAMALLRAEYIGQAFLARRQQLLNKMLIKLKRIAEVHNLAVIITNQVYDKPDGFGNPEVASGGNIMAHASTYRVSLSKKGKVRAAKMVDSPNHEQLQVLYELDEKLGIKDVTKE